MRKKEPNRNSGSLKQTKFSYLELWNNYSCTIVFEMSQYKETFSNSQDKTKVFRENFPDCIYCVGYK